MVAKIAAEQVIKKWLAPALAGGAAATQSEDADASYFGLAAKGANLLGAKAAREVFDEHMLADPAIFANFEELITSGAMQSQAARKAGSSRQGWFIGADGKPRYEASDKAAAIDGNFTKGVAQRISDGMPENSHFPVPLRTFLTHDSLFNAYPDMQDIPVMLRHQRDLPEGVSASYSPPIDGQEEAIHMNLGSILGDDRNESVKSLMHEVQHAIQQREGFARGGSHHNAIFDIDSYLEMPQKHGARNNMPDGGWRMHEALIEPKMEALGRISRARAGVDGIDAPDYIKQDEAAVIDNLGYLMSAGEAEARSVENRLRMPAALRASEHGHPYGDMRMPKDWAEYYFNEGQEGPTLFQMIEMMTREAPE